MKEIPLTNSHLTALVDDEDYPLLSRHVWCIDSGGYARNGQFRMHMLVFGSKQGCVIDHSDRNRLNNQKYNLRFSRHRNNLVNSAAHQDSTSGFKGVSFVKRSGKALAKPWMSQIVKRIEGEEKHFYLGHFATAEEAARAYDVKAKELYGEYAYQNFPEVLV